MIVSKRIHLHDIGKNNVLSETEKNIIDAIHKEDLILYPTETIYGIGGIASPTVEKKIFALKKRTSSNPLILIASSIECFASLNVVFNRSAKTLSDNFWPGHLTLVLSSRDSHKKFGIRVSDDSFVQFVSKHISLPLYSTSANISKEPYNPDPETIFQRFYNKVSYIIDNGILPKSLPSTVVDVSDEASITILREGSIPKNSIFESLKIRDTQ